MRGGLLFFHSEFICLSSLHIKKSHTIKNNQMRSLLFVAVILAVTLMAQAQNNQPTTAPYLGLCAVNMSIVVVAPPACQANIKFTATTAAMDVCETVKCQCLGGTQSPPVQGSNGNKVCSKQASCTSPSSLACLSAKAACGRQAVSLLSQEGACNDTVRNYIGANTCARVVCDETGRTCGDVTYGAACGVMPSTLPTTAPTVSVCSTLTKEIETQPTSTCMANPQFIDISEQYNKCDSVGCQCVSGNNNSFVNGKCTIPIGCSARHLACARAYSTCQSTQIQRLKGIAQCNDFAVQQLSTASCTRTVCNMAGGQDSMGVKTPCSNTDITVACAMSGAAVVRISGAVFAVAMVVLALFA